MARAAITIKQITQAGATSEAPVVGVNADELKLTPSADDICWLVVDNSDSNPHDVTVKTNASYEGLTVPARVVTVPAGGQKVIRLQPLSLYLQGGGDVEIDIATDTYLSFRAFKL